MVISEKFKETRMDGSTVGFTDNDGKGEYDIKDVPHAMRLSNSGTFIHGNYWGADSSSATPTPATAASAWRTSRARATPTTDGAWFFDHSLLGDVVDVVNSPDKTIKPDNGLNGWNMDWSDWKAGSAI